uniref:(California timema) hypothetical protein n=1 Tax=Timema californicum TaxID=61474 RepID=A0A7R9J131_TIMCA|nr:unnamed protein product [Timema californicum]
MRDNQNNIPLVPLVKLFLNHKKVATFKLIPEVQCCDEYTNLVVGEVKLLLCPWTFVQLRVERERLSLDLLPLALMKVEELDHCYRTTYLCGGTLPLLLHNLSSWRNSTIVIGLIYVEKLNILAVGVKNKTEILNI